MRDKPVPEKFCSAEILASIADWGKIAGPAEKLCTLVILFSVNSSAN
jgi:hypothetical protein